MNSKEKLHIAKEAYKGMKCMLHSVEGYKDARVNCMWPGYISVDGTVFGPDELKEDNEKL